MTESPDGRRGVRRPKSFIASRPLCKTVSCEPPAWLAEPTFASPTCGLCTQDGFLHGQATVFRGQTDEFAGDQAKKCDAMEGLLKEGKGLMEDTQMGSLRDSGIIAAAQKIEHYEIATYGTLAAFAKVLGHKDALKEILSTLSEEKACDEKLTAIADTALNTAAING